MYEDKQKHGDGSHIRRNEPTVSLDSGKIASSKWRSPVQNGDRQFKVAIGQLKVAIASSKRRIASSKWRSPLQSGDRWLKVANRQFTKKNEITWP